MELAGSGQFAASAHHRTDGFVLFLDFGGGNAIDSVGFRRIFVVLHAVSIQLAADELLAGASGNGYYRAALQGLENQTVWGANFLEFS